MSARDRGPDSLTADATVIVRVRDVALSGTPAYLVMDLVEGRSLDGWASTGGMPLDRARCC